MALTLPRDGLVMVDTNRVDNDEAAGSRDSVTRRFDGGRAISPTVLALLLRHWVAVVATVAVFAVIGLIVSRFVTTSYVGVAEVITQDPRAASQFDITDAQPSTQDSERYVADQVKIFESGLVASYVAEDLGVDVETVTERLEIVGDLTSNLIEVRYSAGTPEEAARGANTVVTAYVGVVSEQVQQNASVALQKIDALQQGLDDRLDAIGTQIASKLADSPRGDVEQQIEEAVATLTRLRVERDTFPFGSPERDDVEARILEIVTDLDALRLSLDLEQPDPELDALVEEQNQALALRSQLDTRRNTIEVDLELASANLALVSPALAPDEPAGFPPAVTLLGFVALGGLVGLAGAQALELRASRLAAPDHGQVDPASTEPETEPPPSEATAESLFEASGRRPLHVPSITELWGSESGSGDPPQPVETAPATAGDVPPDALADTDDRVAGPAAVRPELDVHRSDRSTPEVRQGGDGDAVTTALAGSGFIGSDAVDEDAVDEDAVAEDAVDDDAVGHHADDNDADDQDGVHESRPGAWAERTDSAWMPATHSRFEAGGVDANGTVVAANGQDVEGDNGGAAPTPGHGPSEGAGDDLTLISGIGPKVAAVLREAGIRRFEDLARHDEAALRTLLLEAGPAYLGCNPRSWPLQAQLAHSRRWTALKALQAQPDR